MRDLVPLLIQRLLLCLGILPAVGTAVELSATAWDSVVSEKSVLLGHILDVPEPSIFDCMASVVRTAAAAAVRKTALVVAVCTLIMVENLPPEATIVVFVLHGDP